ncbi:MULTISPECIES: zinc-dependent alcohol dehydrogenase family protein [Inquilinus]|uniref:NADPH:quinone reductase-like Zn-dependent oxidoreductase n=1 Tax=Inquilinus ginsengisoli TaxID=363840 RepID=A0ABU1JP44_9PROT|nr:NAD(P)-dependent alcohol dehydrogenase [Inquilinus ginsengisoli]MDR6290394.1 NADPH:quinone reductase-like Zn-dependent oxidoreductase [Inquilinus ginsengisoli]
MKAFVIEEGSGLDRLALVERPVPEPRRGEVVLRMRAASLNYRDLEIVRGTYHAGFALPMVPLSDGVGEVVAVGEGVTRVAVGDRVASTFWQGWIAGDFEGIERAVPLGGPGPGVLAEYVRLDAEGVTRVPDHLTDAEAATLPCAALTAWTSLVAEGGLKPGDTVLVQGTGGVAIFALQFAVAAGACAIVTSSSDAKLEQARALGATGTVNYRTTPDWHLAVRELTGGRGVDHVIEVGGPGTFARSLAAIRTGGQINVIGYLGGKSTEINPMEILFRRARIRGIPVGSRDSFEAMNRAVAATGLRPVIDRGFAWTEAPTALRHLESAQHFGKVVLTF